jgi:hypothetical protein
MTKINDDASELGRIRIFGLRNPVKTHSDEALWVVDGYTPRVPAKAGTDGKDGTPGVHGLRTLVLRADSRPMYFQLTGAGRVKERFSDPLLLDVFLMHEDARGGEFDIEMLGITATAQLVRDTRAEVSPLWEHPDSRTLPAKKTANFVPAYLLRTGALQLDAKTLKSGVLPGLDDSFPVELMPDGIVFNAHVPPPDGSAKISTRVRLKYLGDEVRVEFVNPQSPETQAAWRGVWSRLNDIAAASRVTAWARLAFVVDADLPALSWLATKKQGNKIDVKWDELDLPKEVAQITLADQPLESQVLAPLQVLQFARSVRLTLTQTPKPARLTVSAAPATSKSMNAQAVYTWDRKQESIDFTSAVPLVHDAKGVRRRLFSTYAREEADAQIVVGFMMLEDGWAQIPFEADLEDPNTEKRRLPKAIPPGNSPDVRGSLWMGTRRQEFHASSATPDCAAWSIQLDEPKDFSVSFTFELPPNKTTDAILLSAKIELAEFAMAVRGMVWLAATAPDSHDALPVASDNPEAFFDILLRRCEGKEGAAPFVLKPLSISAPKKPHPGWDQGGLRNAPQPVAGVKLEVNLNVTAPASLNNRVWLRHATLPSVQVLAATRSDSSSNRPHASRALTPFDASAHLLILEGPLSMAPRLSAGTRKKFKATAADWKDKDGKIADVSLVPLVALTLPGIELEPWAPDDYRAKGAYTMQLWDEPHARAALPPPDDAPEQAPPPVVTALDAQALMRLMHDNINLRINATTEQSSMFPATVIGTPVAVEAESLYPPLKWQAKVQIDDGLIEDANGAVRFGRVFFDDAPWTWDASGDVLLQGPEGVLNLNGTQCRLRETGKPGDPKLVGWSVQERKSQQGSVDFVRDGRGVSWMNELAVSSGLLARRVQGEDEHGKAYWLLSTDRPIAVEGLAGVAWELSFTDVPISVLTNVMTVPAGLAQYAGRAWTWSLSEPGEDLKITPLSLGACLRFVPAALKDLKWVGAGNITKAVVEGTLVLGKDNRAVTADTTRRVRITMEAVPAGALAITSVDTMDGNPITWDLDLESADGVFSGAPQFSGTLSVEKGVLWIRGLSLLARLFTADFKIELEDVTASAITAVSRAVPDLQLLEVQVSKTVVNLETASLGRVDMTILLREGVKCVITHARTSALTTSTSATLDWFGNSIEWNARIDAARRACVFYRKEGANPDVTLFPGQPTAVFKDGVVCLGFVPQTPGLTVQTHFLELVLEYAGVQVTHMLHCSGDSHVLDTLRFDGTWTQKSLVSWPKPKGVDFDFVGDTQVVDFGTAQEVEHVASFVLSDHCMDGTRFKLAAPKGLQALDGSQAATWLVDTIHRFTAAGVIREVRCLGMLEFWRPSALAKELKAKWEKRDGLEGFGFVPGDIGKLWSGNHTDEFLRPGVRRVDQGHAGLFDEQIVATLGQSSGDSWIMLGGTTALCHDVSEKPGKTPTAAYLLLHLPFVAVLGDGKALGDRLKVVGTGADATLRMSRHDILSQRVYADSTRAQPPGTLISQPLLRALPFARDLRPSATLGGEVLARNWFRMRDTPLVSGWHMEQLQRPGATPQSGQKLKQLPFPYPRAALLLTALLDSLDKGKSESPETLSILIRMHIRDKVESAQPMSVDVQVVCMQPGLGTTTSGNGQAVADTLRSDLIVGGPKGLVAVPIAEADATVEDVKHLIALAIASMTEPVFVVRRTSDPAGAYLNCELPALDRDPLEFSVRPLRPAVNFAADGRLTWPAPAGVEKTQAEVYARARAPRQHPAPLAMAGVTGGIDCSLPMGQPFTLNTTTDAGKTETVWMQEWEHVAYAFTPDQRDDAAPWMRDASASARPLVPSAREIAKALMRMDPALPPERSIQTWLPHAADTIDFTSRAGAFVAMGLRGLRSVNITHRQFEPADAGPSTARTIRRPRPVALPANGTDEQTWRRTVGGYAMKDRTCLALTGAWDTVTAPLRETQDKPLETEVPPWSLFMGQPEPYGLVIESRGAAPVWRGSVSVQCVVFDHNATPLMKPAHLVLGMLQYAMGANNLRCGLRVGARMINFKQIALWEEGGKKSTDTLVFSLGGGESITAGDCTFECGFLPQIALKAQVEPVSIAKPTLPRKTLELVALRMLVLPVRGPVQDRYPLPILRRTVFFADPAFDRKLSRVDPISVSEMFDKDQPEEKFNALIDRPSVTPDETAVVRVKANKLDFPSEPEKPNDLPVIITYQLSATVTRHEGGVPEELMFYLEPGAEPVAVVPLTLGEFYALPTSSLRSRTKGSLRPGDTLILDIVASNFPGRPATRLIVPVKSSSSLPPPQAMYSLITTDRWRCIAWCAAHSPVPVPENMWTEVLDPATDKLLRRGVFKWVVHGSVAAKPLAYSILKAEKATESTHIPQMLELEMQLPTLPDA